MSGRIQVSVRCRPLNAKERGQGEESIISMRNKTVYIQTENGQRDFTFDNAFMSADPSDPTYASQDTLFNEIGKKILQCAFDDGFNSCVFAYGQTSSGKSYTIVGAPDQPGLVPRVCSGIFDKIAERSFEAGEEPPASDPSAAGLLSRTYTVDVAMIEIYNEKVQNLLDAGDARGGRKKRFLRVREHPTQGPFVEGVHPIVVSDAGDISRCLDQGNSNRTIAATQMNHVSSRAHTIFTIRVIELRSMAGPGGSGAISTRQTSKINLVDLAGSERSSKTGATGQRFREGVAINQSLTTLGNVIEQLATREKDRRAGRKTFVRYRDSNLTWLLRESLGGNSQTFMVATISPAKYNMFETLSTLKYADRAKKIQNTPIRNEDPSAKKIRELQEIIARLKAQGAGGGGEDAMQLRKENEELKKKMTTVETHMEELSAETLALRSQITERETKARDLEEEQKVLEEMALEKERLAQEMRDQLLETKEETERQIAEKAALAEKAAQAEREAAEMRDLLQEQLSLVKEHEDENERLRLQAEEKAQAAAELQERLSQAPQSSVVPIADRKALQERAAAMSEDLAREHEAGIALDERRRAKSEEMNRRREEQLQQLGIFENTEENRSTLPHMVNLSSDSSLAGTLVYFFPPQKRIVVGRESSCEIVFDGLGIRDQHAEVYNPGLDEIEGEGEDDDSDRVVLTALGIAEMNSQLFVNGRPIPCGSFVPLCSGDRIIFGKRFVFRYVDPYDEPAPVLFADPFVAVPGGVPGVVPGGGVPGVIPGAVPGVVPDGGEYVPGFVPPGGVPGLVPGVAPVDGVVDPSLLHPSSAALPLPSPLSSAPLGALAAPPVDDYEFAIQEKLRGQAEAQLADSELMKSDSGSSLHDFAAQLEQARTAAEGSDSLQDDREKFDSLQALRESLEKVKAKLESEANEWEAGYEMVRFLLQNQTVGRKLEDKIHTLRGASLERPDDLGLKRRLGEAETKLQRYDPLKTKDRLRGALSRLDEFMKAHLPEDASVFSDSDTINGLQKRVGELEDEEDVLKKAAESDPENRSEIGEQVHASQSRRGVIEGKMTDMREKLFVDVKSILDKKVEQETSRLRQIEQSLHVLTASVRTQAAKLKKGLTMEISRGSMIGQILANHPKLLPVCSKIEEAQMIADELGEDVKFGLTIKYYLETQLFFVQVTNNLKQMISLLPIPTFEERLVDLHEYYNAVKSGSDGLPFDEHPLFRPYVYPIGRALIPLSRLLAALQQTEFEDDEDTDHAVKMTNAISVWVEQDAEDYATEGKVARLSMHCTGDIDELTSSFSLCVNIDKVSRLPARLRDAHIFCSCVNDMTGDVVGDQESGHIAVGGTDFVDIDFPFYLNMQVSEDILPHCFLELSVVGELFNYVGAASGKAPGSFRSPFSQSVRRPVLPNLGSLTPRSARSTPLTPVSQQVLLGDELSEFSELEVVVLKARDLKSATKGFGSIFQAKMMSPYCKVKYREKKVKTPVVQGTSFPEWNQTLRFRLNAPQITDVLEVEVWRTGTFGNTRVGRVFIGFQNVLSLFRRKSAQWFRLRRQGEDSIVGEVKLKFLLE